MNHYPINGLTSEQLAAILAQVVHFSRNDYCVDGTHSPHYPEDAGWSAAYICACFLAQHTLLGHGGVETEYPHTALRIMEDMPYSQRLELAIEAVESHGSV